MAQIVAARDGPVAGPCAIDRFSTETAWANIFGAPSWPKVRPNFRKNKDP